MGIELFGNNRNIINQVQSGGMVSFAPDLTDLKLCREKNLKKWGLSDPWGLGMSGIKYRQNSCLRCQPPRWHHMTPQGQLKPEKFVPRINQGQVLPCIDHSDSDCLGAAIQRHLQCWAPRQYSWEGSVRSKWPNDMENIGDDENDSMNPWTNSESPGSTFTSRNYFYIPELLLHPRRILVV